MRKIKVVLSEEAIVLIVLSIGAMVTFGYIYHEYAVSERAATELGCIR